MVDHADLIVAVPPAGAPQCATPGHAVRPAGDQPVAPPAVPPAHTGVAPPRRSTARTTTAVALALLLGVTRPLGPGGATPPVPRPAVRR